MPWLGAIAPPPKVAISAKFANFHRSDLWQPTAKLLMPRSRTIAGRHRRPLFPPQIWSQFNNTTGGLPRTKNAVEGWHRAFQVIWVLFFFGCSFLGLALFISFLLFFCCYFWDLHYLSEFIWIPNPEWLSGSLSSLWWTFSPTSVEFRITCTFRRLVDCVCIVWFCSSVDFVCIMMLWRVIKKVTVYIN